MTPLLLLLVSAAIGAAALGYVFRRLQLNVAVGAGVGAVGGALGSMLFMVPLEYCMFNPVPEGALYKIDAVDVIFGLILIALSLGLTIWLLSWIAGWWVRRNAPASFQPSPQGVFKGTWLPILLLAPTVIVLALFLYYPSLDTVRLSTLLAKLGAKRTLFVCVDNFTSLVGDPSYGKYIVTTVFISLAIVIIGLALSLMIATMAYQPLFGARIYRTLLIWPYAISPAVAGVIFLLMFNPAGGIINYFLKGTLGVQVGWLNDPVAAPWAVIIASIWKSMGFNILFYIAGLQNVPKDLQEAAAIDGANVVQRFRYVVMPLLAPITFFLVITNLTYAFFETFGTIDYLTPGGGPLNSTTTLMYQIYQVGIGQNDLGKGAAQSIILFVMVIALTVFQFRTQGRQATSGA